MGNSEGSNHGLFMGKATPYPVCYCLVCGAFLSAPHLCQYCPKRSGSARPHRAARYGPKALPLYVSLGPARRTERADLVFIFWHRQGGGLDTCQNTVRNSFAYLPLFLWTLSETLSINHTHSGSCVFSLV